MASTERHTRSRDSYLATEATIRRSLDLLADLLSKYDTLAAPYYLRKTEIEKEKNLATADLRNEIAKTRQQIQELTLDHGESIKATKLYAIYSKGRTTWDSKRLGGYSVAHPEILEMRRVGKPSVSIRKVK